MLSSLLEGLGSQAWSAITFQAFILIADIYVLLKQGANAFIIASATLILSLFTLQVVSSRFLILYPFNNFAHRPTPRMDTYILKVFIYGVPRGKSSRGVSGADA
jgi:hypothetical protein